MHLILFFALAILILLGVLYWISKIFSDHKPSSKSVVYNPLTKEYQNINYRFNKADYDLKYQRLKFYFVEYTRKNGQYFHKGEAVCKIRIGDHINNFDYMCATIYTADKGYLKHTQEYNNVLNENDIVYLLKAEKFSL